MSEYSSNRNQDLHRGRTPETVYQQVVRSVSHLVDVVSNVASVWATDLSKLPVSRNTNSQHAFASLTTARHAVCRARATITSHFGTPIHPVWLRCENLKDKEYSCVFARSAGMHECRWRQDAGCDPCRTGASTPQTRELNIARALNLMTHRR